MILVTGGNGQLAKCLEEANKIFHRDLLFVSRDELDITNERGVANFINEHTPSAIINCAAYTAVDKAEEQRELAHEVNVKGAAVLGEVARLQKIPLIHYSTDYVFDGAKQSPYLECDEPLPLNIYGLTKRAGEVALLNSDIHGAIIRTSWLYSEFAPNFLMTMKRLASTHPEIQVVSDQYGSPTYAGSLAHFTLKHLELLLSNRMDIYHFSNSGVCTWHDFASAILDGEKIKINKILTKDWKCAAKRSLYSVLDCQKISALTSEAMIPWEEGLKLCQSKLS